MTIPQISADDLLSVADDPMQFAEMFDAIIFNTKADARRAALEEAATKLESLSMLRQMWSGSDLIRFAAEIRALLDTPARAT